MSMRESQSGEIKIQNHTNVTDLSTTQNMSGMNYLHQINEATVNASIASGQMRMMPQTQHQKLPVAGAVGLVVGSSICVIGRLEASMSHSGNNHLRNTQLTDNTKVSQG